MKDRGRTDSPRHHPESDHSMNDAQRKILLFLQYARLVIAGGGFLGAALYSGDGDYRWFYLFALMTALWLCASSLSSLSTHHASRHPGDGWLEPSTLTYLQDYDGVSQTPTVRIEYQGDNAERYIERYHERKNNDRA